MGEPRSDGGGEQVQDVPWLLSRCGEGFPLIIDNLLTVPQSIEFMSPSSVASFLKAEVCDAMELLCCDPMWKALQEQNEVMVNTLPPGTTTAQAKCRLCCPDRPLSTVHANRSGSMAEGLHDLMFGFGGSSDYDVMFQLDAGCHWMADPMVEAGTEPALISPESAPQLWAERTDSPGFVRLHWARTSQCPHRMSGRALTAQSIRELTKVFWLVCGHHGASYPGPAVNITVPRLGLRDGGVDHVPCLHLPWWPDKQGFINRHRTTDFPPAAARHDICQYGVHLVPTGRHGSRTELSEWRLSFSRAEVVAAHYLSAEQRATVKAVKYMKTFLKERGEAPALRSYYMKTAVLWLVQDEPGHRWGSVTDAVYMLLDWLERHLIAGRLPCFFWDEINLLSGHEEEEVEDMIRTVKMMRSRAIRMLLTSSARRFPGLTSVLWDGPGPLSERELRLRLARLMVISGATCGVMFRSAAPCWYHWGRCFVPPLVRVSETRLLEWRYRHSSADYHQQCFLLQAMLVAPADLVAGMRLTSHDSGLYTWDVTPLMALLTESDLDMLLGDSAAVAAWCRQQLCRPPAERPAGLTAGLETPRGRAELLLQPELFLRAVGDASASPGIIPDEKLSHQWKIEYPLADDYQLCRLSLQQQLEVPTRRWQAAFQALLPQQNGSRVAAMIYLYRCRLMYLLSGDRLKRKYDAISTRQADCWQLRQFAVQENLTPTADLPQGVERGASDGERWGHSDFHKQESSHEQQQQEEEEEHRFHLWAQRQCCAYITRRDNLVWQHSQQLERKVQHHLRELGELKRRHLQEQTEKQEGQHRQELMELKQRHGQEREELKRRQLQELDECYKSAWKKPEFRAVEQNGWPSAS